MSSETVSRVSSPVKSHCSLACGRVCFLPGGRRNSRSETAASVSKVHSKGQRVIFPVSLCVTPQGALGSPHPLQWSWKNCCTGVSRGRGHSSRRGHEAARVPGRTESEGDDQPKTVPVKTVCSPASGLDAKSRGHSRWELFKYLGQQAH